MTQLVHRSEAWSMRPALLLKSSEVQRSNAASVIPGDQRPYLGRTNIIIADAHTRRTGRLHACWKSKLPIGLLGHSFHCGGCAHNLPLQRVLQWPTSSLQPEQAQRQHAGTHHRPWKAVVIARPMCSSCNLGGHNQQCPRLPRLGRGH